MAFWPLVPPGTLAQESDYLRAPRREWLRLAAEAFARKSCIVASAHDLTLHDSGKVAAPRAMPCPSNATDSEPHYYSSTWTKKAR
eukprot:3947686-Prymnesium_polylepis.3